MSNIVLSGQVTAVLPLQQGVSQRSGQPWVSQDYILCHEQGQYPKSVCFKIFGEEKIKQFAIQQGEQLTVHLSIDCKQGQKGYFNDISCWKVERQGQQQAQQMPQQQVQQPMGQQAYQQQPMQAGFQQQMPQQGYQQQAVQSPFPPQQPMQQQVATPFPQQGMQQVAVPF